MPRHFVQRELDKTLAKRQSIAAAQLASDLSRVFHVSAEVMQYRLTNLGGLDPAALVG
ncbi:hypothetical protein BH20ACT14_BH20ACT14_00860 [soil metagenome]